MLNFIAFLIGEGTDQSGRVLSDYFGFDAAKWEDCHDHMQWAFPTRTKSMYNAKAPTVPDDFKFDGNAEVTASISELLDRYLASLGVKRAHSEDGTLAFLWIPSRPEEFVWVNKGNHNMLRMTRVLECLNIFGMTAERDALYNMLMYDIAAECPTYFDARTLVFWVAAKENKLHLVR